MSDLNASVLGCATTMLFCRPDLPKSSGCLDGFSGTLFGGNGTDGFDALWPEKDRESTIRTIVDLLNQSPESFYWLPSVSAILAGDTVTGNEQLAALPADQWKTEREHLFRAALTQFQSKLVDFARGFWDGGGVLCKQEGASCRRACHTQVCPLPLTTQRHSLTSTASQVPQILLLPCLHPHAGRSPRRPDHARSHVPRRPHRPANQTHAPLQHQTCLRTRDLESELDNATPPLGA